MVGKLGYLTPSFKDAEEKEPTAYGENRGPLDRGEGYVPTTQYHGFIHSVQFLQCVRDHFPSSGSRKTSFSFPASKPQWSQRFKCPVCKQNSYNVSRFLHRNCCDSITCLTSVPTKVCFFKLKKKKKKKVTSGIVLPSSTYYSYYSSLHNPPPPPPRLQPFLTVPPFTLKYDTIYMTLTNVMLGGGWGERVLADERKHTRDHFLPHVHMACFKWLPNGKGPWYTKMIRKYAKRALDLSNYVPRIRSGSVRNAVSSFSRRGVAWGEGTRPVSHGVGVVTKQ